MSNKKKISKVQTVLCGLCIFNVVYQLFINSGEPETGEYHLYLHTIFLGLLVIYSVWSIIVVIGELKIKEGSVVFNIAVLLVTLLLTVLCVIDSIPYIKDLKSGSKTIITNNYLITKNQIHFLDDNEEEITLEISKDKAETLKNKANDGFDSDYNYIIYKDAIRIKYYPNSKVVIGL